MCGAFIRYVLWPALMFPIARYVPLVMGLCSPLTWALGSLGLVRCARVLYYSYNPAETLCMRKPSHPVVTGWLGSVAEDVGFEPTRVLLPARVPGV